MKNIIGHFFNFLSSLSILASTTTALAWGERGHNTVGYVAALATQTALTPEEKIKVGTLFSERTFQFGHLSNIPDISWKDPRNSSARKLNPPSHYLDSEVLVGLPTNGYDEAYLKRVRDIEKDFKILQKTFDDKPNSLPGANGKKLNVYFDAGSAPWRAQELYDLMVYALVCANSKPLVKGSYERSKNFQDPFKKAQGKKPYTCNPKSTRHENIYAAIVFAGILGHFVGDLSQPQHCTADFNGWVTGQAGIHNYFETIVVQIFKEDFKAKVANSASQSGTNEKIWAKIGGGNPRDKSFVTQTMLNLAADSLKYLPEVQKIDREFAMTKEGEKRKWGEGPGVGHAERKPVTDIVAQKFEPLITDRIITASVVLSHLWVEAWRQAGRPDLSDITLISIPYPLDVPFIAPGYAGKL